MDNHDTEDEHSHEIFGPEHQGDSKKFLMVPKSFEKSKTGETYSSHDSYKFIAHYNNLATANKACKVHKEMRMEDFLRNSIELAARTMKPGAVGEH